MKYTNDKLKLAADTVRCLAADAIEKAKSGHPGAPMGMADLAVSLWLKFLNFDPKDVNWEMRDRLVFSGGHASMLVYSLFHLAGVKGCEMDQVQTFRQLGSRCAGHPERGVMPGVEVTTGPLGQGIAMGVGMALASRRNGDTNHTWVFCGDGDLEEGISHEACSFAGNLKLGGLTLVYDSNGITIEGSTALSMADDPKKRFESYGWKVLECDGHDYDQIDRVYRRALKITDMPVIIIAKTTIGLGAPTKKGTSGVHGAPLGAEELAGLKKNLGFDPEKSFQVPDEVYDMFEQRAVRCHRMRNIYEKAKKSAEEAAPAAKYKAEDLYAALPAFDPEKPVATRAANGTVMNALAKVATDLIGGSADLEPSNKTGLKEYKWLKAGDLSGRNIHFGIRELAMSAIVNGITAYGGYRAFGATFFVFSDYCRPAIRLAALMKLPSIWVFSHDSFYVGEDGPTHEPVEQLAAMRTMPNVATFRPADANETGWCWVEMLKNVSGPSCILTTRQNLPILEGTSAEGVARGAYTVYQSSAHPEYLFLASGSEVSLCVEAAKQLAETGRAVRVVSMPCRELFERQPLEYRESVVPGTCAKRVIVEAGVRFGWGSYVVDASKTRFVTLDSYGESGPYKVLAEHFGFTVENVLAKAKELY
jgi:transketolase